MSNSSAENSLDYKPSCTVEDAVMYLLGYKQSDIQAKWYQPSDDPSDGEWLSGFGFDHLKDLLAEAESEYAEVKYDKCPEEVVAEKLAKLDECRSIIKRAHGYKSAVINELAKPQGSKLLTDPTVTDERFKHIPLLSLKTWAKSVFNINILMDLDIPKYKKSIAKSRNVQARTEIWWKPHDKKDMEVLHDWFIPARYFAREIIAEVQKTGKPTPTKVELGKLVAICLRDKAHIPSKTKIYDAGYVRKAFNDVNF